MESDQIFDFIGGVVLISVAIFILTRIRYFPKQKDLIFLASTGLTIFATTTFIETFTNVLSGGMVLTLTGFAAAIIFVCIGACRRRKPKAQQIGDGNAVKPPGDERTP